MSTQHIFKCDICKMNDSVKGKIYGLMTDTADWQFSIDTKDLFNVSLHLCTSCHEKLGDLLKKDEVEE